MGENCENSAKVDDLASVVKDLVKETAVQVGVVSKMEYVLHSLSDSMEVLARSQLKIEQHSEQIKVANKRISDNEMDIRDINNKMTGTCAMKSRELTDVNDKIIKQIDDEVEKVDRRSNNRFMLSLTILAAAFGYLVIDDQSGRAKMDEILKTVVENKVTIGHLKEEMHAYKTGSLILPVGHK